MKRIAVHGRRAGRWLTRRAGWCLAGSLALYALTALLSPAEPLDLRVYHEAAPHVLTGGLYDQVVRTGPPIPELPFTYPPFAALVLLPLAHLPWTAAVVLWRAASLAAVLVVTAGALRLLPHRFGGDRDRALLWAAAAPWLEPVRHTLDQGQINLLLGAAVVGGLAFGRRATVRGTSVALAASLKLTPAVAGAYLLATRQWRAAGWAVATGGAAVGLAWWIAPGESERYWSGLVTDTRRVGPVWSVRNQSLRGALTRLLGHDAGGTALWWAALALVTLAAAGALRAALRRDDPLGVLVTVELYGLLVCPVSWSHHWIWCLPAMIWLAHGPHRTRAAARTVLVLWAAVTGARLVPRLIGAEDRLARPGPYPWALAWPGCVYAGCALLTFLVLALPARRTGAAGSPEYDRDAAAGRSPLRPDEAAVSSRRGRARPATGRPVRRAPDPWRWSAGPGRRRGWR
ncbi:glycosyltransferase 87 family protein [Streptomyces sp. NPDC003703]|uniref:glycosyltransferase 87 family protein n=1 Tax=Streptomyces sp. NPDC003283 TaxID=3364681 RepID=UPI0036D09270